MPTLTQLLDLGFDETKHDPTTHTHRVRCSQCAATVVNGTPIHERGCPNEVVECNGCNTLLPASVARIQPYCKDCR